MKFKKGDLVLITAGKDKGRTGKIMKSLPRELKVLVEGINLKKKHVRPKKEGEKGQVVDIPVPLNISNIKMVCPKCGKATRVGYKIEKDIYPVKSAEGGVAPKAQQFNRVKKRVCKRCKQEI